jgi:D-alanine-D-alanine ligase
MVEEFMKGKEITVGILEDIPLPIIEIVPKSGFYDYHSKYTKGETQYIIPARIPRERYLYAQESASRPLMRWVAQDVPGWICLSWAGQ